MAKDWIKFFGLVGDPFNTIPLQTDNDFRFLLVKTDDIDRQIDPLLTHFEQSEPFLRIIVGRRGSGKSTVLHYAVSKVKQNKKMVAAYVAHVPSVVAGLKDVNYGIGNDTISRILTEMTQAALTSEERNRDSELLEIAQEIGYHREDNLQDRSVDPGLSWSYSVAYRRLRRLLEYFRSRKIRVLLAIDNYDKHGDDTAISFLRSRYAQPLFEEMQGAGVSILLTALEEWGEASSKDPALSYLGEPIHLCPVNPIEARSLVRKRIAAKMEPTGTEAIFDDDAISSITVKKEGIARYILEICRICLIEAAKRDIRFVGKDLVDEIFRTLELRAQKYYECVKEDPVAVNGLFRLVNLWKNVEPDGYRRILYGLVDIWEMRTAEEKVTEILREKRLIYLTTDIAKQRNVPSKADQSLGEVEKSRPGPTLQISPEVAALFRNLGKKYSLKPFVDWLAKGEPKFFFVTAVKEQETFRQSKLDFQQILPMFTRNDLKLMLRNAQTSYNSWNTEIESGDYEVAQILSDMWTCLWNLSLCAYFAIRVIIEEKTYKKP